MALHSITFAETFYVAPRDATPAGNDNNPGTIEAPWATWGKAFNSRQVKPGDTVFFRGGVYYKDLSEGETNWYYPGRDEGGTGYNISRDGLPGQYVHYYAFPDDFNAGNPPVLDHNGVNNYPQSTMVYAIRADDVKYVRFYGLHIRNVDQLPGKHWAEGFRIDGNQVYIENCKVYDVHGAGFSLGGNPGDTMYVINCDAYLCCDSLSSSLPGNDGSGFRHSDNGAVFYKGCRAWLCGDQGFSNGIADPWEAEQYTDYENCWAFNNGMIQGGGTGFKMGWISYTDGKLKRNYRNCIAAFNRWNGFKTNDYIHTYAVHVNIFNCIAYRNGHDPEWGREYGCYGFEIHDSNDNDANELQRRLVNNIAFDNQHGPVTLMDGAVYTHSFNTWDTEVSVDSSDFVSLDSTGLAGPRQPDGSLPDLDFLKLREGSDLIDAGTDVGYGYSGGAPDLGPYEFGIQSESSNKSPTVRITSPSEGSEFLSRTSIALAAEATDTDGSVSKVEYYQNGSMIGEATSAPWEVTWEEVPEGTHSIIAIAFDNHNNSAESTEITVKVDSQPQGVYDLQPDIFKLYPNPNDGRFTVELAEPVEESQQERTIMVSSFDGRLIYFETLGKDETRTQVDLSHINPGTYVLKLIGNFIIATKKFVKI